MDNTDLKVKLFISGKIKLLTGLHIGGSSSIVDIGGIDSNVIKTSEGAPYIPGSSLKGKMRFLYAMKAGSYSVDDDPDECKAVYGYHKDNKNKKARLIVRDSYLDEEHFRSIKDKLELEMPYTEAKWENTIDRKTSAANPRQIERVPAGVTFKFNFVYSIFNDTDIENLKVVVESMRLLNNDYLGGSGTRGYGEIEFADFETVKIKTKRAYEKDNVAGNLSKNFSLDGDNEEFFNEIKDKIKQNN